MSASRSHFLRLISIVCFGMAMLTAAGTYAQTKNDTAGKVPVELLPGIGNLYVIQTDSGDIDKLIGNVGLRQGETTMYCDSAYFNLTKNTVEAFGNVRVIQPGSEGQSDYMRYIGNQKLAYMKGNVSLTDGKSNLWSEELEYNTVTKVGTYTQGGTLQDSTTTLSSNSGVYNMQTKDSRFTGEVIVTDPKYNIVSDDMGYNTETKVVRFFAPSIVTSDSSVLHTSCGSFDTKDQIANFPCRSSVINVDQFLQADTLYHNRKNGVGRAIGNVIAIDTTHHTTLYCGRDDFNEKKKTSLATIKPVLKQVNGKDSLFIRADTLFSFPVLHKDVTTAKKKGQTNKVIDSLQQVNDTMHFAKATVVSKRTKKKVDTKTNVQEDTTTVDARYRKFIGYHHVLIFSDSMQGRCDSISYSDEDSVIRMMYDPVVWSRKSQITGDTILAYMDSSSIKKIFVPNNAYVISRTGPAKAKLFDQVQGKTLTAFFKDSKMDFMLVTPDAQVIHFPKDDGGAYIGANESSGVRLKAFFNEDDLDHITFEKDFKTKLTPMNKADIPSLRLTRFRWLDKLRPRTKEELFK